MRNELIDKLFEVFEEDKNLIKENLLKVMDVVYLQCCDKYETISLTIKIDKNKGVNYENIKK